MTIDPVELKALLSDMDASPVKYEMGYRTSMPGSKLWALGPALARQVLALSEEVWRLKRERDDEGRIASTFNEAQLKRAEADAKALRQRLGEIREIASNSDKRGWSDFDRIAALAAIQDENGSPS